MNFVLTKYDPMELYFKCKDKTGRTNTSSFKDAMKFSTMAKAIDYNHKHLFGDYEVQSLNL